jgi:hypothetical protein
MKSILTMQRRPSFGGATISELFAPLSAVRMMYMLEDEVREIEGEPVEAWKIKGATAIPAGRYRITFEHSTRFGPDTLTINNVPGFVAIRIHGGNTSADTEGCPLTGFEATTASIVGGTSQPALRALKAWVRTEMDNGNEVWIDVCNAVEVA